MKGVNKTTYCVLALLFGVLGLHKFYSGKTKEGIIYLICFAIGFPALVTIILSFVDFCTPLQKKPDSNNLIYM